MKANLSSVAGEAPLTQAMPGASATAESVRSEVGYIPAIEGLRGVAVLWVVIFHYAAVREPRFADPFVAWIDSSRALATIVRNGYLGVDLFFLITGFLLTLPWFRHASEGRGAPSVRDFYVRRARRIVPAYYVQLAFLFFVFVPLLLGPIWSAARSFVLGNLALHVLFLHQTSPYSSASLSVNGALWTLALEMQYYLLLPLIAAAFVRRPWVCAVGMVGATVAWRLLAAYDLQPLIALYGAIGRRWDPTEAMLRQLATTQLPGYLAHFALGILCGRAWWASRGTAPSVVQAWGLAALCASGLIALYAMLANGQFAANAFGAVLIAGAMALVMWAAVSRRPAWGVRILGVRPLALVGRISYSMYLYHLPLVLLFNKYAGSTFGYFAFPCYFAGVAALSALSFRYVELPFIRKKPGPAGAKSVSNGADVPDPTRAGVKP